MRRKIDGLTGESEDSPAYTLLGADGRFYASHTPGVLGGHKGSKIYGALGCPSALRAIARGGYVKHRVFFADEATAVAAGYRPCAVCCHDQYRAYKAATTNGYSTVGDV
jgi:Metal binding domain of Ada